MLACYKPHHLCCHFWYYPLKNAVRRILCTRPTSTHNDKSLAVCYQMCIGVRCHNHSVCGDRKRSEPLALVLSWLYRMQCNAMLHSFVLRWDCERNEAVVPPSIRRRKLQIIHCFVVLGPPADSPHLLLLYGTNCALFVFRFVTIRRQTPKHTDQLT